MEVNAETLFNTLGKRYEDAYADSPGLLSVVKHALAKLPPHSQVLDVGCGTGKPVAATLASAGHSVHGIDVAETMVKIAANQVPGVFLKADMRKYTPPVPMDAVFAIYSLFQIPPSETWMMVYRFAEWLKDGGLVVLGVAPSSALSAVEGTRDRVWDCVRACVTWMERPVHEVYFSESGWRSLLQGAGFVIEAEEMFEFVPRDPKHTRVETHYLIVARKTLSGPLLGPYPFPEARHVKAGRDESAWGMLQEHLTIEDDEQGRFARLLEHNVRILDIGGGLKTFLGSSSKASRSVQTLDVLSDSLPYPDNHFDAVIATMALDHVDNVSDFMGELVRVTDSSSPNARIMIIQGAPYNEVLRAVRTVCSPLSQSNPGPSHQGHLLHSAREALSTIGFGDVSLHRLSTLYSVQEEHPSDWCGQITELLLDTWFADGSEHDQMEKELVDVLEGFLHDHPGFIRNELMIMEAKPGVC